MRSENCINAFKYINISSISLIMKEEVFFESVGEVNITTNKNSTTMQSASTDNDIGLIMSLSMSLLGFWINDLTPRVIS